MIFVVPQPDRLHGLSLELRLKAVEMVIETGKAIVEVARDLGRPVRRA